MFETTSLYNSIFVLQKNSFCRAFSIIILELLLLKQYQRSIIAYLLHNLVCDQLISRVFSRKCWINMCQMITKKLRLINFLFTQSIRIYQTAWRF